MRVQSPLNRVGDGPLASAMEDKPQDARHAHFEDGDVDGNGYDSFTAHHHADEYGEVLPFCITLAYGGAANSHGYDAPVLRRCPRI